MAIIEVLEYQLKRNMLKVSIKATGRNPLKWYFNMQFHRLYIVSIGKFRLRRRYIKKFWSSWPVLIASWENNNNKKLTALFSRFYYFVWPKFTPSCSVSVEPSEQKNCKWQFDMLNLVYLNTCCVKEILTTSMETTNF